MFRMWAKIWKNNHMIKDTVVEDASDRGRTQKVFHAMDEIIYTFDLGKPIWLDKTVKEFQNHSRARFYQDNFIETIDFDYLEIQMIEEEQIMEQQFLKISKNPQKIKKCGIINVAI